MKRTNELKLNAVASFKKMVVALKNKATREDDAEARQAMAELEIEVIAIEASVLKSETLAHLPSSDEAA